MSVSRNLPVRLFGAGSRSTRDLLVIERREIDLMAGLAIRTDVAVLVKRSFVPYTRYSISDQHELYT